MASGGACLFVALFTDGYMMLPSLSWNERSRMTAVIASIERADLCGLCSMAASMWSHDQPSLQSTGQLSRAYLASSGAAWCSTAFPLLLGLLLSPELLFK
eukprot:9838629-Ditylum_brightwellii.AAC.1